MKKDIQVDDRIARFLKRKSDQYPEIDYLANQLARKG